MQDHRTQLAALIASRICHDLISPVGAISNGLELIALGGGAQDGPEMALISESCGNANARIRFFRVAFGEASENAKLSANEVQDILTGMYADSRCNVTWPHHGDIARRDAQLAFLALQCVETALRRGGDIRIALDHAGLSVDGQAERITQDPALWSHLDMPTDQSKVMGEAIDIAPAYVQFVMLPMFAAARGKRPAVTQTEGRITLSV